MAKFAYIEVLKNGGDGVWELNLELGKALFRDWEHKKEKDDETIHDWHEVYTTIEQYLHEEMKMQYVKEIIPDMKYIFSKDQEFCSYYSIGFVAHDPNQKIHCTQLATIYKNGEPFCNKHGHVNF